MTAHNFVPAPPAPLAERARGALEVVIVGGGMITHDQLLPSLYHLQRLGLVASIRVCALNSGPLKALAEEPKFREAFPGQSFEASPPLAEPPEKAFPDLYLDVIAGLAPRNLRRE